jgi:predicted secreted protein
VDLLVSISTDNGTTYKTLVCLTKSANALTRAVNKTVTQCGVFVSKGGAAEETVTIEGVVNVVVAAENANFLSYKELRAFVKNGTAVQVKQANSDDGTGVEITGDAYMSELNLDAPVDNIATFTATLNLF